MKPWLPIAFVGVLITAPALAQDTRPESAPAAVTIQYENDMIGAATDKHYTSGVRASFVADPSWGWVYDSAKWVSKFMPEAFTGKDPVMTYTASLGQSLYTPEDIRETNVITDDRPYAGWTYGTVGAVADDWKSDTLHQISLDVGFIGPFSLGEETQTFVHKVIDSPKPKGWDHQLKTELGLQLNYGVQKRFGTETGLPFFDEIDVVPHATFALGNVFTYGAMGGTVRIGTGLDVDYGPPRIRPSLPGSGLVRKRDVAGFYLFAGLEGRGVARNIFLDGNTFAESHDVKRIPWVTDAQAGIAATYGPVRASFTYIWRSPEFEGQRGGDQFSAFSVSYLF